MKFVFRNLKIFAKTEPVIFFVMLICVITSSFILNISYGLYRNYSTALIEGDEAMKEINPELNEDAPLSKGDFQRYIEALQPETRDKLTLIYAAAHLPSEEDPNEKIYFPMRFNYNNGEYCASALVKDIWEQSGLITEGRFLNDEEEKDGLFSAIVPSSSRGRLGDTTEMFGKEYTIVGKYNNPSKCPLVPFLTVPSDLKIDACSFTFKSALTRKMYEDITRTAFAVIPDRMKFPKLALPDDDMARLYGNIILISLLIAILSVMNFAMLYLFVIRKRKNSLAVFRICGATKLSVLMIYLGECLAISVPSFWLGTGIFHILLKSVFGGIFPYMEEAFNPFVYPSIFLIYMITMFAIIIPMIVKNVKTDIKSCLAEGKI